MKEHDRVFVKDEGVCGYVVVASEDAGYREYEVQIPTDEGIELRVFPEDALLPVEVDFLEGRLISLPEGYYIGDKALSTVLNKHDEHEVRITIERVVKEV